MVQKSPNLFLPLPPAPLRPCSLSDKSLTGHDITPLYQFQRRLQNREERKQAAINPVASANNAATKA